ncbi:hypothetical protein GW17_00016928 [Ensete ventricosum]|nr:hypothetical protein GW17_00016928 [Ensete ventricosum]
MLNSVKRDRIFSSMRFPKTSSIASIASSDAIVYASRSIILRSFFCCQVEVRVIAIVGIAWEGGSVDDGYRGNKIAALILDDRTPDEAL